MTEQTWCEGSGTSPDTMTFDDFGNPLGPCPRCNIEFDLDGFGMVPQHARSVDEAERA